MIQAIIDLITFWEEINGYIKLLKITPSQERQKIIDKIDEAFRNNDISAIADIANRKL